MSTDASLTPSAKLHRSSGWKAIAVMLGLGPVMSLAMGTLFGAVMLSHSFGNNLAGFLVGIGGLALIGGLIGGYTILLVRVVPERKAEKADVNDRRPYSANLDAALLELLDETAPADRAEKRSHLVGFIAGARFGLGYSPDSDERIEAEIRRRAQKPRR